MAWFTVHRATGPHTAGSFRVDPMATHLCCSCTLKVTGSQQVTGPTSHWLLLWDALHTSRVYFKGNAVEHRTVVPTGRYIQQEVLSLLL